MFRSTATRIAQRVSDVIDDMLLGDFEYVEAGTQLYADIDYQRRYGANPRFANHHHREWLTSRIERRPDPAECANTAPSTACGRRKAVAG